MGKRPDYLRIKVDGEAQNATYLRIFLEDVVVASVTSSGRSDLTAVYYWFYRGGRWSSRDAGQLRLETDGDAPSQLVTAQWWDGA